MALMPIPAKCLYVLVFAALIFGFESPAHAVASGPETLLWGNLQPGKYAVGFRYSFQFDWSRAYDAAYPLSGHGKEAKKARPILAGIWYPARAGGSARMAFRDYLDLRGEDPRLADFPARLSKFTRSVVCEDLFEKKEALLPKEEREEFERLLSSATFAQKDAPPAEGRFPLIIYHHGAGGTYEEDSVLFEFLASHGYVILSSAYQDVDSSDVGTADEATTSWRDMEALLRFAGTLPFVDTTRVAAMGHSLGAQRALGWSFEPGSALDAVVSLDSTIEYNQLKDHHFFDLNLDPEKEITVPVFRFASWHEPEMHWPETRFEVLDEVLKFAPNYAAAVSFMRHDDYLSDGVIGRVLVAAPNATETRRGYDRVGETVLTFLNAYVTRDDSAMATLKQFATNKEKNDETFRWRYVAPAPRAPTGRQIVMLYDSVGRTGTRAILEGLTADLDSGNFLSAGREFLERGDSKDAMIMYNWATKIVGRDWRVHQLLAEIHTANGELSEAADAYRESLAALAQEAGWKESVRTVVKAQLEAALNGLPHK